MRATLSNIEQHWTDCPPELGTANRTSLEYIRELGARTNTNISRWNLISVFGNGQEANLKTDNNELNRLFFAKMAAGGQEQDVTPPLDPACKQALQAFSAAIVDREVQQLRQQATNYLQDARARYNQFEHSLREANRITARADAFVPTTASANRVTRFEQGLEEVLAGDFWADPIFESGGIVWLRTTQDVIVTERRRAAGINTSVNCGVLAVRLDMINSVVRVLPYRHNRKYNGYYHPHIHTDGSMCWGDGHEMATRHIAEWNVSALLTLLQSVLINYNAGNPFIQLEYLNTRGAAMRAARSGSMRSAYAARDYEARAARRRPSTGFTPDAQVSDEVDEEETEQEEDI